MSPYEQALADAIGANWRGMQKYRRQALVAANASERRLAVAVAREAHSRVGVLLGVRRSARFYARFAVLRTCRLPRCHAVPEADGLCRLHLHLHRMETDSAYRARIQAPADLPDTCDTCGREATSWWSAGRMLYACDGCSSETDAWAHRLSAYPDGPHAIEGVPA